MKETKLFNINSNIGEKENHYSFSGYKENISSIHKYNLDRTIIVGKSGSGKTHLHNPSATLRNRAIIPAWFGALALTLSS